MRGSRTVASPNRLTRFLLLLGCCAVLAGCGYRRPVRIPTTGTVLLDDEPVAQASLVFLPADGGRPAMAHSDENGQFTVSTFGGGDGLPAGKYKLAATKLVLRKRAQQRLDAFNASEEAQDGGDIQFSDADYQNELPNRYNDPRSSDYEIVIDRTGEPLTISLTSAEE